MKVDSDGNVIEGRRRGQDRYFVTGHDGIEVETDAAGFISMERSCGFQPKSGSGFATAGFTSGDRAGRIEQWFEGPADVLDGDTGDSSQFLGCVAAYDYARDLNARAGKNRFHVLRAEDR